MAEQFYPTGTPGYSWAGQPPQSSNAFATAGTSMIQDYAIMRQNQEMSMYQQAMTPPSYRSISQQREIAFSPEGQFGMLDGPMQMQNRLHRNTMFGATAFATTATSIMATLPLYTMGDQIAGWGAKRVFGAAAGRGLMMRAGTFAAGIGIGTVLAAPIEAAFEHGMNRQRWAADIEDDIESYSGRWTQGRGFGGAITHQLGQDMMRSMTNRQEFFRPEDQLKINKMGLASGLLRGGDASEYKKNFEDLKKNAKDIIQMLNTTIEGGMSVMKEMQGAGFRSPAMMAQQIAQAKGFGVISGIGTQNMLGIGMAGAMNSVGTGWSGVAASNMYQNVATNLTLAAQSNGMTANAIVGVGGIQNATAQVANSNMNMLRSGFGLRAMTAVMDPTNKLLDPDLLDRLRSGRMGASEIIDRSNRYGTSGPMGGALNRVTVNRDISRIQNNMSDDALMDIQRGTYMAWARTRGGINESTGFAWARQFAPNDEIADLMAQNMMGPSQRLTKQAQERAENFTMTAANQVWRTPLSRSINNFAFNAGQMWNSVGDAAIGVSGAVVGSMARGMQTVTNAIAPSWWEMNMRKYQPPAAQNTAEMAYADRIVTDVDVRSAQGLRMSPVRKIDRDGSARSIAAEWIYGNIVKGNREAYTHLLGAAQEVAASGHSTIFDKGGPVYEILQNAVKAGKLNMSNLRDSDIAPILGDVSLRVQEYNNAKPVGWSPLDVSTRNFSFSVSDRRYNEAKDVLTPFVSIANSHFWNESANDNKSGFNQLLKYAKAQGRAGFQAIQEETQKMFPGVDLGKYVDALDAVKAIQTYEKERGAFNQSVRINTLIAGAGEKQATAASAALDHVFNNKFNKQDVKEILGLPTAQNDKSLFGLTYSSDTFMNATGKDLVLAKEGFRAAVLGSSKLGDNPYDTASAQLVSVMTDYSREAKKLSKLPPGEKDAQEKIVNDLLNKANNLSNIIHNNISGQNTNGVVASSTPPNILNYWNSNWRVGQ